MVDQQIAHDLRRHAEEVRAAFPGSILFAREAHVSFMHQGRSLQGVAGFLRAHAPPRHTPKIVVYDRDQPLQRILVPPAPRGEQRGHISRHLAHFNARSGEHGATERE